jgi:hypothetical protein
MTRGLRPFLILLLLALSPNAAHARSDRDEACVQGSAKPVTVIELTKAKARLDGHCVQLTAYQVDDVIFDEREAFYLHMTKRPNSARVVGIAYDGRRWDAETPRKATFVGRVVDCAAQQARFARADRRRSRSMSGSGEIIMTHHYGFCGHNPGAALFLKDIVQPQDVAMARIADGHGPTKVGDLELAPPKFDFQGKISALVDVAMKQGCDENFAVDPIVFQGKNGTADSLSMPNMEADGRGAFLSDLCGKTGEQVRRYRVSPLSPHYAENAKLDMLVCACRSGDCTGRWPIALFDTNWSQTRPYFCQRVTYRPHKQSGAGRNADYSDWWFEFPENNGLYFMRGSGWFAEPSLQ